MLLIVLTLLLTLGQISKNVSTLNDNNKDKKITKAREEVNSEKIEVADLPEIIIKIEEIAQQQDYNKLVDYLLILTKNITQQEAVVVADWLQQKENDGNAPYIYLQALFLLSANDKVRVFEVYQSAKLNARLDERRCNTDIAVKAKNKYENSYGLPIEKMIEKRSYMENMADKLFAYNNELLMKNSPVAQWVCTNNYENSLDIKNLLNDNDWHDVRTKIRAGYLIPSE